MAKERMKPAPPTVAVYWRGEVTNTATGKRVRRTRRFRARSFVVAFSQYIIRNMFGININAQDISDTTRALGVSTFSLANTVATFGQETRGIVTGTGTTALDAADFYLATAIVHGTSSGQLSYGATSVGAIASGSSTTSFDIVRSMGNSSGASISVEEIGLVASQNISASTRGFCLIRDLTGTIAVGSGETLTVTYTITTTV